MRTGSVTKRANRRSRYHGPMPLRWRIVPLLTLVVVAAGCNSDSGDANTTTSSLVPITTTSRPPTTTSTTTTLAPIEEATFPEYTIVSRSSEDNGDVVVVLLEPASYDNLSDLDLYDVTADVVEQFPPVYEAHIVDRTDAAELVLREDLTDAERAILAEHYFVRLEEGFRVVYVGPFSSAGTAVLGS